MGQSPSISKPRSPKPSTIFISPPEMEPDPDDSSFQGQDYTFNLPDECLAYIFHSLSSGDRKRASLVCHRWLRIEGQSGYRLSLNAQSDLWCAYIIIKIQEEVFNLPHSILHSCMILCTPSGSSFSSYPGGIMAEQSKSSEKHEQQKMLLQNFQFDTVKPQMRSSGSMPNSPIALRKSTSVRQNCLCSPTTHVGSFRCRYHRSTNMTRNSMSVGAKLSDLAEKQSDMIIKSAT